MSLTASSHRNGQGRYDVFVVKQGDDGVSETRVVKTCDTSPQANAEVRRLNMLKPEELKSAFDDAGGTSGNKGENTADQNPQNGAELNNTDKTNNPGDDTLGGAGKDE